MRLGYDLTIEQTQKLTMTPELIQAIQILQFNTQELESFVQEELMQNPVLEYDSTDVKKEPEVSKTEALDRKEAEDSEIDLREKVKEAEYDDISYRQWEYSKDHDETSFEQYVSKEAEDSEIDLREKVKEAEYDDISYRQWERDCINALETELAVVKRSILQAEREARTATSVQEKIEQEKKVEELKRKKRRLRNELEDREDEISEQRRKMIAELEQKMIQSTESQNLFLIRWIIK